MLYADEDRRRRWRFFHENAGHVVGRSAETALELARAESLLDRAEELGAARFVLEDDPEPYDPGDVDTPEQVARYFESGRWTGPFWARVETSTEGSDSASLGGIVVGPRGADDPYIRTVRAELALELTDDLRAAIARAEVVELADELAARVGVARARAELRQVLDTIEQEAGR